MADSATLGRGRLGSEHKDFTIQSTEVPPPPPPDFETLWPLLIYIIGTILIGAGATYAATA